MKSFKKNTDNVIEMQANQATGKGCLMRRKSINAPFS